MSNQQIQKEECKRKMGVGLAWIKGVFDGFPMPSNKFPVWVSLAGNYAPLADMDYDPCLSILFNSWEELENFDQKFEEFWRTNKTLLENYVPPGKVGGMQTTMAIAADRRRWG